jgi:arylsulfatase A-like enzyme
VIRPNFVIFLTDDQGYGDLSCMGQTDFRTPHLDRLAATGVRFTNWYSNSPVCSPSRAALLTGRYPGNAGVRAILAGHRTATGLPPEVPTLATVLRGAGYATGIVGKWHLGLAAGSRPQDHGFDASFGFMAGCVDYYSHIFYWGMNRGGPGNDPTHDLWANGAEVWRNGEYLTDVIADEAVAFVRRAATQDAPFLLYVPFNAPHYPMHAPQKYLDRFPDLPPDRRIMAAMLSAMDDAVGAVVAELERQGILDHTCLFFMSDNGPSRETRNWLDGRADPYYGGSAGGLKGHKFSLFEGGIRVPGILCWPDRVPAGQVVHAPAAAMDIFPTFLDAAEVAYDGEMDGRSLLPAVTAGAPSPHDRLFWEMDDQTAVRQGPWKLVLNGRLVEGAPPEDTVHLANLDDDPGERHNLATAHPDLAADLTAAAEIWRQGIETRWQSQWLPRATGTTAHP